ncbi:MATE efflux family protein [Actibacterium atlanticum]|uniref:Multidrug-efflux transporter n=1 Tax=Actibacterium atlanticum TaxID=1461693 RepID=A0A058ZIZ7_9RHOB|nr:MATE family efflux transporter [Actibacterium atlanticum]KCV81599.1 MATE efflux family protein [Actibacterium atlanticum]
MTQVAQTYAQHFRAILILGLPLVGSQLAQFGITLTDAVMLGWYDVEALAAEVVGGGIFFVLFVVGSGFAMAVTPMVARARAAGEGRQPRRITRMALWLSTLFGLACLPVFVFSGPLMRALGQEDTIAELARQYLSVRGWGIVAALWVMVLESYLAALERTRVILWVTLVAVVLNALGNYALIFGNWGAPELGIAGAGWASLGVSGAMVLVLVVYVIRAVPDDSLFTRLWRPDWEAFRAVFQLGWPIGITHLAEVGLFAFSSVMMGWIGTIELAAHGIALQIASLVFMVHLGLASAGTVRAGQAVGRQDQFNLRRGAMVLVYMSGAVGVVTILVFLLLPETLLGLFLSPQDPDRGAVIAIGIGLLAAAALFQFVDAAQVLAMGLLRGVQDTQVPMVLAAVSYWLIGMPVAYVLGFTLNWGGIGIWLGLAVGLAVAAASTMYRFWTRNYIA